MLKWLKNVRWAVCREESESLLNSPTRWSSANSMFKRLIKVLYVLHFCISCCLTGARIKIQTQLSSSTESSNAFLRKTIEKILTRPLRYLNPYSISMVLRSLVPAHFHTCMHHFPLCLSTSMRGLSLLWERENNFKAVYYTDATVLSPLFMRLHSTTTLSTLICRSNVKSLFCAFHPNL